MNQPYFGAYQSGFQTLPKNAYDMMTAPSRQIAGAVTDTVGKLADAYTGRAAELEGTEALKQGSAAQYSGLESLSKATGIPMNPELANQFMNMNEMKTKAQQAAFQNSLGQEAQRIQSLYNIGNQQRQMQQGIYSQDTLSRGLSAPFYGGGAPSAGAAPAMPVGQGGMPAYNPLFGY